MNDKMKNIVLGAMFAALTGAATMAVRIPTPGTGGYIHPGDALVILTGIFMGPWWGFLSAGIGSAMSDLLGGYFAYVPITFAIKGLVAAASGILYHSLDRSAKTRMAAVALGGVADVIIVALGYFICEASFLGYGVGAAASVPANIVQGIGGLVISVLLYPMLIQVPELRALASAVPVKH